MSNFNYVSCIKIGGDPILPPVIYPADRPLLQKYKEAAIQKEKEIKERSISLRNSQAHEISVGLSDDDTDESLTSQTSVKTAQVMWFIRQALKNVGVNTVDVKSLQSQIFHELNDIQKSNSCDTLHNFESSSVFASTSAEASPEKPNRLSESFEPVGDEPNENGPHSTIHSERSLSLPLSGSPNSPLGITTGTPCQQSYPTTPRTEDPIPRLIRRNSYTLSSPSPGVLSYFKSLTKAPENRTPTNAVSSKGAKRNLNEVWSTPDASPLDNIDQVFDLNNHSKSDGSADSGTNGLFQIKSESSNQVVRKPTWEENAISRSEKELAATKIQAGVRGYLVRRLLRTARIMELKNSIKDSLITALELFTDPEVKDKNELDLRRHLTLQLEKLCDEWHSLIIDSTPQERMKIIRVDRHKIERQKLAKSVPKRPITRKSKKVTENKTHVPRSLVQSFKSHEMQTSTDPKSKRRVAPTTLDLSKSTPSNYKPWS